MSLKLREEKKSKTSKKKFSVPGKGHLSTELTTTCKEGAGIIVKALLMRFLNIVAA